MPPSPLLDVIRPVCDARSCSSYLEAIRTHIRKLLGRKWKEYVFVYTF